MRNTTTRTVGRALYRGLPVLVLLLAGCRGRETGLPATPAASTDDGVSASRRTALVQAVERVAPTVVSVNALERRTVSGIDPRTLEFFRRFFPDFPGVQDQYIPRMGSGIVLDSKGFFLTNDHLVGRAAQIWVTLPNREVFECEVVGTDPNYDLAVIRVKQQGTEVFQTTPLGNSDDLMVGEWALALGNPFGNFVGDPRPSVTVGVVSAVHRDVKISEGSAIYKDMIQTDASINPGNSGGPLVNADGDVIGINTFIFSQGGGSLGIGFAIPINTAMSVAEELILYGHVRGVWIGMAVQQLSPALANQLGLPDRQGLVVWSLEAGSPAARAGIHLGDVVRAVDGTPVRDAEEARRTIFGARVGDTITFTVARGGKLLNIPVTLEPLPAERQGRQSPQ
jgi:serine protease Do